MDDNTPTPAAPQADLAGVQRRYQVLLDRWHQGQPRRLRTEIIQLPSGENGHTAIVRAEAETADASFAALGSVDALTASSDRTTVLLEWAELLAKMGALRDACNAAALAFGFEQLPTPAPIPPPARPVYSTSVVENGRVIAGGIGQPLGSPTRAIGSTNRAGILPSGSVATAPTGQGGEQSSSTVMYTFLSRLVGRVQNNSRAITPDELLHPSHILQEQQTISFNADGRALEKAADALLELLSQRQAVATVYIGVQRLSRMKPLEARCRALLEVADRVYVFGIDDIALWTHTKMPVIRLRPAAGNGLDRFWYVVCNDDRFRTTLLAEQIGNTADSGIAYTRYKGFWTFESQLTKEATTILDQAATLLR